MFVDESRFLEEDWESLLVVAAPGLGTEVAPAPPMPVVVWVDGMSSGEDDADPPAVIVGDDIDCCSSALKLACSTSCGSCRKLCTSVSFLKMGCNATLYLLRCQ